MPEQPNPNLDGQGLPPGYPLKPELEITPRELQELLESDDHAQRPTVVDVREADELRVAPFAGAIHLPLGEVERRASDLADELEDARDLEEGQGTKCPVAVLCHGGVRSLRATLALKALGFEDVRSVAGGIELWSIDIDPSIPRY